MRVRAAALTFVIVALQPASATAQGFLAQGFSTQGSSAQGLSTQMLSVQPMAGPALRPSLPAQPPTPKDLVLVTVRGGAAMTHLTKVSRGPDFRAGRAVEFAGLVTTHARANDVPEHLVHRIIMRESKYQPNLIGRGGTIGMMQIKLATARGMGYAGTADGLLDPQTNLTWGVRYLAGAWRAAQGNADLAVRKYAAGYYVRKARTATAR